MYPAIVQEIHNEFQTASDKIMKEAEDFLKEVTSVNTEKISLLQKLGFVQTREVKEGSEAVSKAQRHKELMKLVSEYAMKYPNNKFITEAQVFQICEKYNLICGDVSRYKGFVPQSKLEQIANFKLREEHISEFTFTLRCDFDEGITENDYFDENDLTEVGLRYVRSKGLRDSLFVTGRGGTHNYNQDLITQECKNRFLGRRFIELHWHKGAGKLQICAPESDMDTSGMQVRNRKLVHVPDPVVLQPVKGGYLIVAAWGDEASDPIVVNDTMN